MKIFIYGLNFSPELIGVGKFTGELAEWLARQKNSVRVLTANPYYPQWRIFHGYSALLYSKHNVTQNLTVYRCPLYVPDFPSGLKRILHLASFVLSSLPLLFLHALWKPRVLIVIQPTFGCLLPAWILSKLTGAKLWLHIQDFEIDAAFSMGLIKNRFLKKMILGIESYLMTKCDRISSISNNMLAYAQKKGATPAQLIYFPNWTNLKLKEQKSKKDLLYRQLNISPQNTLLLYSGNMGNKQGLELLAYAAKNLVSYTHIVFIFCGEGSQKLKLMQLCHGLKNVRFLNLLPPSVFPSLLNLVDIHLLPQIEAVSDLVMPSKLATMLASGRPIIAVTESKTEVSKVLRNNGMIVPPSNPMKFSDAILKLARDKKLRHALGKKSRQYAKNHFDKDKILNQFVKDLNHSSFN
jgi:colanic acid biosynthesis glycosyl transferase WcaI